MIDKLLEPDTERYITCDVCGGEIYEGDCYWIINGLCHCKCCKDDFLAECEECYEPADS